MVLGSPGAVSAGGDGAQVAGVPVGVNATLRMYGANTPTADTLANFKIYSQDMMDPVNGIIFTPGAASLLNQYFDYTQLPYRKGARYITLGTNTGVVAAQGFTIDEYPVGNCVAGSRGMGGEVMTGANTFGGALTANTWGQLAYTPTNALPNGKYAILGAYVSAITNSALIRFSHSDFGFAKPGFPIHNFETISTATWDKMNKDALVQGEVGQQFVYLSEILGKPCCPVFNASNAGTGLNIEIVSCQADTPVVNLMLARVG